MISLRKVLLFTPDSKFKSRFFNLFGASYLPMLFYLFTYITKKIKKFHYQNYFNKTKFDLTKLEKNGYLVINDFISQEELIVIENEIQRFKKNQKIINENDFSFPLMTLTKNNLNCNILDKYFGPNSNLYKFITTINGIGSELNPEIEYREILNNDLKKDSFEDDQHLLHFDVTYNSYKAIFYLNPVTEENGAFRIIPSSHITNIKRLIREYKFFLSKKTDKLQSLYSKEIYNLKSLEGTKNTLIIMNSKSLHSRGIFKEPGSRKTLFIDYRFLNTPLNLFSLYKFRNKIEKKYD